MKLILILLIVTGVAGALIYVRFAPHDVAEWHQMPAAVTNRDFSAGAMRVVGGDGLERLNEIILATPRTEVLAGSVEEGMITYVTRSAVLGFPDYTTIRLAGPQIEIIGRLRFGRSDLGVNAARIDRWIGALAEGG
ncbi:FIG00992753: hypothetical protein [hydrothermal vent metagenome]|uniref:DUF1499 domain-containing protein n=1 Tax=hydrothermal vent metagenome TaxID=652676 RepID=A0A3B0SG32_9ZZZZ